MFLGVPYVPFFMGAGGCMLLAMYFNLFYLLLIPPMIFDVRTRGRPHPVYLIALPALAFAAWVVIPISETAAWHAFARDFARLAGHP